MVDVRRCYRQPEKECCDGGTYKQKSQQLINWLRAGKTGYISSVAGIDTGLAGCAILCEHLQFLEEGVSMEDLVEHLSLKLTLLRWRTEERGSRHFIAKHTMSEVVCEGVSEGVSV